MVPLWEGLFHWIGDDFALDFVDEVIVVKKFNQPSDMSGHLRWRLCRLGFWRYWAIRIRDTLCTVRLAWMT